MNDYFLSTIVIALFTSILFGCLYLELMEITNGIQLK